MANVRMLFHGDVTSECSEKTVEVYVNTKKKLFIIAGVSLTIFLLSISSFEIGIDNLLFWLSVISRLV
jgi:hypothetical protein